MWKTTINNLTLAIGITVIGLLNPDPSNAFGIQNLPHAYGTLFGGARWDAAPRTIGPNDCLFMRYVPQTCTPSVLIEESERSLDGGLRYSLQGGSFQAYRDLFTWQTLPTVAEFQSAIEDAFNAWTVIDPVSGLGTSLSFIADLATPVVGTGMEGINPNGAEIDLLAATNAVLWDSNPPEQGDVLVLGQAFQASIDSSVTLTSGTKNYAGSYAIAGSDITMNNNTWAVYPSLDYFRRVLTHEIGHAIGLLDVEGEIFPNTFIDDNYDDTNSATALATLTNPIAHLINPLNPAASPFSVFTVLATDPGLYTPGVGILMQSWTTGLQPHLGEDESNPVSNLTPLSNDEYAGRQFLFPQAVSEPTSTFSFLVLGIIGAGSALKRKLKPS